MRAPSQAPYARRFHTAPESPRVAQANPGSGRRLADRNRDSRTVEVREGICQESLFSIRRASGPAGWARSRALPGNYAPPALMPCQHTGDASLRGNKGERNSPRWPPRFLRSNCPHPWHSATTAS